MGRESQKWVHSVYFKLTSLELKVQGFHCMGAGFDPCLGNQDPTMEKKNKTD